MQSVNGAQFLKTKSLLAPFSTAVLGLSPAVTLAITLALPFKILKSEAKKEKTKDQLLYNKSVNNMSLFV